VSELSVIRHQPNNRFLERALAANADVIGTVNRGPQHFDRKAYERVRLLSHPASS